MARSPVVTLYKKTFTSGLLKGLTVDGAVSHPDRSHAEKFARQLLSKKVQHAECVTGAEFVASDVRVRTLSKLTPEQVARYGLSHLVSAS